MIIVKGEAPMDLLQSLLFVPGDSSRKLRSARGLHPDAFIFDLEDAVPADRKSEARSVIGAELENAANFPAKIFIRVNAVGSPFLDDDLRVAAGPRIYGIVLPKCKAPSEVTRVHEKILELERQRGMVEGAIKLVLMLETAKGVAHAGELASSSARTIALMFGGEDYCADMGIARTKAGDEVTFARSLVALAAKSENLEAIDGVYTDFHDATGLFEETQRIKQMGFTGKALIHPSQIDVVHSAMAPSEQEVAWAEEVLGTFERAGEGVAVVRGRMVDEPIVRQAKRILQQSPQGRKKKK